MALLEQELTVPEAAYLAGVTERVINQEIEASVVKPRRVKAQRCLSPKDVVYLVAVREMRSDIAPKLRKRFRAAIGAAMEQGKPSAEVESFELHLKNVFREVTSRFHGLEKSREQFIEQRAGVLGGDPVIKGTRIAAHLIASLLSRGMDRAEIAEELELTQDQIEAALLFARTSPKRGRPSRRRLKATEHVPADR